MGDSDERDAGFDGFDLMEEFHRQLEERKRAAWDEWVERLDAERRRFEGWLEEELWVRRERLARLYVRAIARAWGKLPPERHDAMRREMLAAREPEMPPSIRALSDEQLEARDAELQASIGDYRAQNLEWEE